MKSFNNHINEALISKSTQLRKKELKPKTPKELKIIIADKLEASNSPVLDLSDVDVSLIDNFAFLFYNLNKLHPEITTIKLVDWDTSKVTNMSYMFSHCQKVKEIIGLEYFDVKNVTTFMSMFRNCKSLVSLDLSLWETESVIDLSNMFDNCTKLKHISGIENFNTENIESTSSMFNSCNKIEKIDLNNWQTGKLSVLSGMFFNCRHLKQVSIGNINTKSLSNCENMFRGCAALEIIDDLSNWLINYTAENFSYMFKDCISLVRVYGVDKWFKKGYYFKQKINLEGMFQDCINLKDVGDMNGWKNNYFNLNTKNMFDNTNLEENIPSWYYQNQ